MRRLLSVPIATALMTAGNVMAQGLPAPFQDVPPGFILPPLDPRGAELRTQQIGPGAYAILATTPPVDNSGFIVGSRSVLVIDSHINGEFGRRIINSVRAVTDLPIRYLVNTNYHGDHSFGNYVFPATALVVAHESAAPHLEEIESERLLLTAAMGGDGAVLADVVRRGADITFRDHLKLDLGGRSVDIYHFGRGSSDGDIVVYDSVSGAAWTGNLVTGDPSIPMMWAAGPVEYARTITLLAETIQPRVIVPGHLGPTDMGKVERYLAYSRWLGARASELARENVSPRDAVEMVPLPAEFAPGPQWGAAMAAYWAGIHALNVQNATAEAFGPTRP